MSGVSLLLFPCSCVLVVVSSSLPSFCSYQLKTAELFCFLKEVLDDDNRAHGLNSPSLCKQGCLLQHKVSEWLSYLSREERLVPCTSALTVQCLWVPSQAWMQKCRTTCLNCSGSELGLESSEDFCDSMDVTSSFLPMVPRPTDSCCHLLNASRCSGCLLKTRGRIYKDCQD